MFVENTYLISPALMLHFKISTQHSADDAMTGIKGQEKANKWFKKIKDKT